MNAHAGDKWNRTIAREALEADLAAAEDEIRRLTEALKAITQVRLPARADRSMEWAVGQARLEMRRIALDALALSAAAREGEAP